MLKSKLLGKKLGFQDVHYSCNVSFLTDDNPITVAYKVYICEKRIGLKDWLGEEIFSRVCSHLNLAEKDFFGLRYIDQQDQRVWLDLKKPIYKQLKHVTDLSFRVKFYPSDPSKLKEQLTKYLLFLQLERDLKQGRLLASTSQLIHLSAYMIQAKLGPEPIEEENDITPLLSKNARYFSNDVVREREQIIDMSVADAEKQFVCMCLRLDTYGIDPVAARDVLGEVIFVGVNHTGVMVLKQTKVSLALPWNQITRMDYQGKMLTLHTLSCRGESSKEFMKLPSSDSCKCLWKKLLEQQHFFTLQNSADARKVRSGKSLFRRTSSFRFRGMCEHDVWRSVTSLNRIEPPVVRSISNISHTGYHSVPPSILQSSFASSNLGSINTSPISSPIMLTRLETANEVEEKEDDKLSTNNIIPVGPEQEVTNQEEFHSMDEVSAMDEDERRMEGVSERKQEMDDSKTDGWKVDDKQNGVLYHKGEQNEKTGMNDGWMDGKDTQIRRRVVKMSEGTKEDVWTKENEISLIGKFEKMVLSHLWLVVFVIFFLIVFYLRAIF